MLKDYFDIENQLDEVKTAIAEFYSLKANKTSNYEMQDLYGKICDREIKIIDQALQLIIGKRGKVTRRND